MHRHHNFESLVDLVVSEMPRQKYHYAPNESTIKAGEGFFNPTGSKFGYSTGCTTQDLSIQQPSQPMNIQSFQQMQDAHILEQAQIFRNNGRQFQGGYEITPKLHLHLHGYDEDNITHGDFKDVETGERFGNLNGFEASIAAATAEKLNFNKYAFGNAREEYFEPSPKLSIFDQVREDMQKQQEIFDQINYAIRNAYER